MVWDGMHFVVGTLVGRAGRRPPPKSFGSRLLTLYRGVITAYICLFRIACVGNGLYLVPLCRIWSGKG